MSLNLYAAWLGLLAGCIAGVVPGLFFHRDAWLGGYASWPRRMIRLGHISFFGIGALNLGFALTVAHLGLEHGLLAPSALLLVGAVTMPLVCYLSAAWPPGRNLFFIPAGAVTIAIALSLWRFLAV